MSMTLTLTFKVKCEGAIGLPIYNFLFMVNSNIRHNSAPLRDITLLNLSDLDFNLSMSLKVKYGVIGLPILVCLPISV